MLIENDTVRKAEVTLICSHLMNSLGAQIAEIAAKMLATARVRSDSSNTMSAVVKSNCFFSLFDIFFVLGIDTLNISGDHHLNWPNWPLLCKQQPIPTITLAEDNSGR